MGTMSILRGGTLVLALVATLACGEPTGKGEAKAHTLPPQLEELFATVGANDLERAKELLAQIDREALADEQHALVDRMEAQVLSVTGEPARALESLKHALDSGALPESEVSAARFDLAWLYGTSGDPAHAVEAYRSWQASLKGEPTHAQLLTMSEAYAAAHECSEAAALIGKVYASVTPSERIDVAAAAEIASPLCPSDPQLTKYARLNVNE